jgi:3-methyladenine DNA glycosylase AlkD
MNQILLELRRRLKEASDPVKAPQMRAYMKSEMPYHGVPSPIARKISREVFKPVELKDRADWEKLVLHLWRNAKFREERYAALHLCAERRCRDFHEPAAMPMYEEIIVSGAWWDFVDDASGRVGEILEKYPAKMKPLLRRWSRDENFWKRRVSIIGQRHLKKETDLALLYDCIEPSLGSKEFFLQKAIGWALREVAWFDPKEVKRYVKENEKRLAPLSKREALKNL